jgi:O-antigen ligase
MKGLAFSPLQSRDPLVREFAVTCLWIAFFVGVAAPPHAVTSFNIERIVWLAADAAVFVYVLLRPGKVLDFVRRQPIMLAWCLVAMLSALWSQNAGISLYHGVQLLLTVLVAAMLCLTKPLDEILVILFTSLVIAMLLSLSMLVVLPTAAFDHNGAFRGLLHHKNELGGLMTLLLLVSVTLFAAGRLRWLAAGAIVTAALTLLLSRSGTSIVMTMVWFCPFILAATYQMGPRAFLITVGLTLIASAVLVLVVSASEVDVAGLVLGSVGKDKTLTGRTLLWSIAWDAFLQHPVLGYGFKGYWEGQFTSANYLRIASGENLWFFHNVYLETAVAFGVGGPLLLVAGLAHGLKHGIARYAVDRNFITLWSPLLILFLFTYCLAENPLFVNHNPWQFLLVVALDARARLAQPAARRVRVRPTHTDGWQGEGNPA